MTDKSRSLHIILSETEVNTSDHEFTDRFAAGIGRFNGESVRFSNRGVESPSITELIRCATVPLIDELQEEDAADWVEAETGDVRTGYCVDQRKSPGAPVLIIRHENRDQH